MNSMKFTELYKIINTRLLNQNGKITKTIISTNLDLQGLFRTYDERIVSNIINRYLEQKDTVFFELLDIIGSEFDDVNFLDFILGIYDYSRQLPFPQEWFSSLSEFYNNGEFNENSIWAQYAFDLTESITSELVIALTNARELLSVYEPAEKYVTSFSQAENILNTLYSTAKQREWDALYNALCTFFLPKLPSASRKDAEPPEVLAAKDIYKSVPKAIERLQKLFYADKRFISAQYNRLYQPLCLLSEILIEADNEILEEYKRLNTFTFHNTEHLALQLLCKNNNGEIIMHPQAIDIINRFDEVMVDEYQDTNDLQDMLFKVLSCDERRLFVVGDIKQSIYGFRGANPKNFLTKKNRYIPIENADETKPQKIILGKNFRCKPESCEFINYFFKLFMNESTGDIVYNSEEMLIPAAVYPKLSAPSTELDIIDCKESDTPAAILEARRIAEYVKATMAEGEIIRVDDTTLRNAKYSDFAILLRSAKLKAPAIAEELKKQGIPVSYAVEDFAESTEISTFLRLLSVIDNPKNDVDLLCVLMSPIFSFTAEETANIRSESRQGDLYSAIVFAAESGFDKAKLFLKAIERYRLLSVTKPMPAFISQLLQESGYLDIVSVMNDGNRRRSNLLLLCKYAEQFYADGCTSIGAFYKKILKASSFGIKGAGSAGGDAVRIMSIHASKGLQFPICIIAGLSSAFNDSESKMQTIYTTDFGIGFKYYDEQLKTKLTTVSREAILDLIRVTRLEEELRLFYVAMTRTQDRLLFISALSNLEKKAGELSSILLASESKITPYLFSRTKSYSDWLLLSMLLHPNGTALRGNGSSLMLSDTDSKIMLSIIEGNSLAKKSECISTAVPQPNAETVAAIKDNLSFEYPFKDILDLESKASVSRLANSAESQKYSFSKIPSFMSNGGIAANERGTAMHKIMQFFDFQKYTDIETELDRLYEWQFISEREREAANIEGLKSFFRSSVFARMRSAKILKREMRFLTEINARKIAPQLDTRFDSETVIVQGAVDVCFTEEDGVVILDFKTDSVSSPEALIETYGEQLNFYATACEKIFEMPVKEKIIYSFSLGCEIIL